VPKTATAFFTGSNLASWLAAGAKALLHPDKTQAASRIKKQIKKTTKWQNKKASSS
jgi:hypothetical protein